MPNRFTHTFTAGPDDIDIMGHVNNAVWVQWMEAIATAHWMQDAAPEHVERYVWVVTRHEIDYRGNIAQGQSVTAETFIPEGPVGARFDRRIDFRNDAGKVIVSARSTWAMLDKDTLRLTRVSGEIAEAFAPEGGWGG
ncbi:acyl-CoA thioester hydrolase [Novosphingobium sp. SG751A]|uniref:acyl-CoA thioesterase n=1 Tax=Novosphingobium sp. SG751A TaxID=2587000 RepID=UPI001553B145|nr:acyl-CoA thioesterase [Novosphingobium sp. SG751A]NOW45677.1 acyl-CoA thioester hydrolase [Novosphingobium sp. SG751A]